MIDYNKENINALKLYNEYFHKKFCDLNIRVHKGEGAFYMFLDFGYYSDKFKNNNMMNDTDFCTRLLDDIGFALLPGNAFGIHDGYTARFSMTNFSNDDDFTKVTDNNQRAIILLKEWLNKL
jgi:aspartate/methionine/tyrosine aminotransferase